MLRDKRTVVRPVAEKNFESPIWQRRERRLLDYEAAHRSILNGSNNVSDFIVTGLTLVGKGSFQKDQQRVLEQVGLVRRWATVLWTLVGPNGRSVVVELPSGPLELEPLAEHAMAKGDFWKDSWGLAWAFDDHELTAALLQAGWEVTDHGPGVTSTPFSLLAVEILQRVEEEDPHWLEMCRDGIELSKPEAVGEKMFKYYKRSHTVFRLLEASVNPSDPQTFNDRLYDALIGYQDYLKRMNSMGSEDLAIAWLVLGITARAYRAGMRIEVESDYIPAWIYRREWPA